MGIGIEEGLISLFADLRRLWRDSSSSSEIGLTVCVNRPTTPQENAFRAAWPRAEGNLPQAQWTVRPSRSQRGLPLNLKSACPSKFAKLSEATRASPQKSNTGPAVMHRQAMDHGMYFDSFQLPPSAFSPGCPASKGCGQRNYKRSSMLL